MHSTFYDFIWHWVKFGLFLLRLKGLGCKKVSSESFEGKKGGVFFRKRWRERERKQGKTALKLLEKNALWHYWAWDGLALESCDVEALTAERKKKSAANHWRTAKNRATNIRQAWDFKELPDTNLVTPQNMRAKRANSNWRIFWKVRKISSNDKVTSSNLTNFPKLKIVYGF